MREYLKRGLCLDIGPKDEPFLPINHVNSRFLDVEDKESLILRYARTGTKLKREKVPKIDYVWDGTLSYAELTHS